MKNSTIFGIASILCAIWCMATVYGVAIGKIGVTYWVEYIFHSIPFICFVLCLVLHNMEMKSKLKDKEKEL